MADAPPTAQMQAQVQAPSWEQLGELVAAALAADGDGIGVDTVDRGAGGGGPPGVSAADMALVEALKGMKQVGVGVCLSPCVSTEIDEPGCCIVSIASPLALMGQPNGPAVYRVHRVALTK